MLSVIVMIMTTVVLMRWHRARSPLRYHNTIGMTAICGQDSEMCGTLSSA
jgi:hypothetical protein